MNFLIREGDGSVASKTLTNFLFEIGYDSVEDFQFHNNLKKDGEFGLKSFKELYNCVLSPIEIDFEGFYTKHKTSKNQIVWHHSAGWDNVRGMFQWWKSDGVKHVATSIGINDGGQLFRGFNEEYWAHHLGVKHQVFSNKKLSTNNTILNKNCVGVEICNWGRLLERGKEFYAAIAVDHGFKPKFKIHPSKVVRLDYKGYTFYEKYTDEEIETLRKWTLIQAIRWNIPLKYSHSDMWGVSDNALSGKSGLFTHNSYRKDKTDVSPQPKLIEMAMSLEQYQK